MCRWLAYRGAAIPLESYVTLPHHSLIRQSIAAKEGLVATNGDGFGLGWYGANAEPGLYKEVRPAWSDENLRHLCRHITAHLFFAHVRASTGTPTTRPNCHPFAHGRFLFMHNGQVGDWGLIRRQVEALIPDNCYRTRIGTTDSEAAFLAIMGAGAETDVVGALTRTVETLTDIVRRSGSDDPFRFTIALADGETLYALRYAYPREAAHTLYFQDDGHSAVFASEPLDAEAGLWRPAPVNALLIARRDQPVDIQPFLEAPLAVAAE